MFYFCWLRSLHTGFHIVTIDSILCSLHQLRYYIFCKDVSIVPQWRGLPTSSVHYPLTYQLKTYFCNLTVLRCLPRNKLRLHLVLDWCRFLFECAGFPRKFQPHSHSTPTNLTSHHSLWCPAKNKASKRKKNEEKWMEQRRLCRIILKSFGRDAQFRVWNNR